MEIIKGKSMNPYGIMLVASVVFFIMSFWLFINKDESGGAKALELAGDTKSIVGQVERTQGEIKKEAEALANTMTQTLGDLNKRVEDLEKRPDTIHHINVHMPLEITVVDKRLPSPPPGLVPPNKKVKPGSPLSKRAQLIPTENN